MDLIGLIALCVAASVLMQTVSFLRRRRRVALAPSGGVVGVLPIRASRPSWARYALLTGWVNLVGAVMNGVLIAVSSGEDENWKWGGSLVAFWGMAWLFLAGQGLCGFPKGYFDKDHPRKSNVGDGFTGCLVLVWFVVAVIIIMRRFMATS